MMSTLRVTLGIGLALTLAPLAASGLDDNAPPIVVSAHRISAAEGGLTGKLARLDSFGWATALTGDFDGDTRRELVVGSHGADDGIDDGGAIWILGLGADGRVQRESKISQLTPSFRGPLLHGDAFGFSLADPGDLDGNGIADLAVGAALDDDAGVDAGAVWILFFGKQGELLRSRKISPRYSWLRWLPRRIQGGFNGDVTAGGFFGVSVAGIGDLNGDGVTDLAVGDRRVERAEGRGGVWILFLDQQGTVLRHQEISSGVGGLQTELDPGDEFGFSLAPLGDLDGDGVNDLAVGARGDDDGGSSLGAVWILFLNADGTVKREQKISRRHGGFEGDLHIDDEFGVAVGACPDLDGDTVPDLLVGARGDGDGAEGTGAVWVLFLKRDGTVKGHRKISNSHGGFPGGLERKEWFGSSVTCLDDLDGNGVVDIAVGAEGYRQHGAVWILLMAPMN